MCDPRIPFCKENLKCKNDWCLNGGKCLDSVVGNKTEAVCVCPLGLVGDRCEKAAYCEQNSELCGESAKCVAYNQNYKCECDSSSVGHRCQQSKEIIYKLIIILL